MMHHPLVSPLLIVILAVAIFFGFHPMITHTDSPVAKDFISAAVAAIFISMVTLFLIRAQSRSDAQKEKETTIFQEKLKVFNAFMESLNRLIIRIQIDGEPIRLRDLKELLFRLSNVRMHCKSNTAHEVIEQIQKLLMSTDGSKKLRQRFDITDLVRIQFTVGDLFNQELFPEQKSTKEATDEKVGDIFDELLHATEQDIALVEELEKKFEEQEQKSEGKGKQKHSDEFKKKVAKAYRDERGSYAKIGDEFGVHPTLVRNWYRKEYVRDDQKESDAGS